MHTPLAQSTPKRAVRPKTPKFDPEVHGADIEGDLQVEDGVDTFLQLIKRSPKKQAVESKNLEVQPQLDLGDEVQVMGMQLPAPTELQGVLSEGLSQIEETAIEPKVGTAIH